MLNLWVPRVQCCSGTRQKAAVAVCKAEIGTGEVVGVDGDGDFKFFLLDDAGVYGALLSLVVKKVELRVTNSCALV